MILCGDIGGTKSLLGLADGGRLVLDRRLANADFRDFQSLLEAFLEDIGGQRSAIAAVHLAVAGPIADSGTTARLTNRPWTIDADELTRRFGLPPARLINDFAAAALGAVTAAADALVTLQAGDMLADAAHLVVGAGTGLGMALAIRDGEGWRVLPGEGGHVGFSPQDETMAKIHAALLAEHGRVTAERVISGPGLATIHRILHGAVLDPAQVADAALAVAGPERESLDIFLAAYGAYAGDMALATLARGGVFLAGGIAARVLPALRSGGFLAAFNAKAEHAAIAARMPVHVVVDPLAGLRGAARFAEAPR